MKTLPLHGSESVREMADQMAIPGREAIRVAFERMGRLWTLSDHPSRPDIVEFVGQFGFQVRWVDSPPS